jgi:hypothetical protein
MRIVQLKSDARAYPMNIHGERDGKLRPIVDPHDVARAHAGEHWTEYPPYNPAMKKPRQVRKISSETLIEFQAVQQADGFRGKFPGIIRRRAHNHRMRYVPEHVGDPARDCPSVEFGKWLCFCKNMKRGAVHRNSLSWWKLS